MLQAEISLIIDGDRLVYGGRGYQPLARFNRGDKICDDYNIVENDFNGQCWVEIEGKTYGISHNDYTVQYPDDVE